MEDRELRKKRNGKGQQSRRRKEGIRESMTEDMKSRKSPALHLPPSFRPPTLMRMQ